MESEVEWTPSPGPAGDAGRLVCSPQNSEFLLGGGGRSRGFLQEERKLRRPGCNVHPAKDCRCCEGMKAQHLQQLGPPRLLPRDVPGRTVDCRRSVPPGTHRSVPDLCSQPALLKLSSGSAFSLGVFKPKHCPVPSYLLL